MLALVGVEAEDPAQDPAAVLTTLASVRDRLRVFVNAGSLKPPTTAHRLFGRYDRVLRPVHLDGAFHPKVWVMKFVPLERPEQRREAPIFRVLCASRNATAASTWELGVTLEGTLGRTPSAFGSELARFLRIVAGRSTTVPSPIATMLGELPRVGFETGREGAQDLRFEWQWPGTRQLRAALPAKASRALLISPFLRVQFVERLCAAVDDLTIVSRQEELDALPEATHARLKDADVFVVTGQGDDEVKALELHAKLLAWEHGTASETLIGSANGTTSAWGLGQIRNCEAMVALRPGVRVSEVYRAFVSDKKGTFHGWIEPYERQTLEVSEEDKAQREIDAAVRLIASVPLAGTYARDGHTLCIRLATGGVLPALPSTVTVELVPLLQQHTAGWQPFSGLTTGLRFSPVALADLSAFALVRLKHRTGQGLEDTACLQFQLDLPEKDWEARDDAMNARLLENVNVREILLNLLQGRVAGLSLASASSNRASSSAVSLLGLVTIERVLEACTADPTRVPQVDALLRACREDPTLDAFREFWANLQQALGEGNPRV
ncbi:MAG: phospholipase D family protein [Vicinamibacterales bacterium]